MPIDCTDIKAMISGIVDGELEAQTRHEAERHLSHCRECRLLVDDAERVNDLLIRDVESLTGGSALPASFAEGVLRRTVYTDAYNFAGRRWTSWLGWVAAAACLMLACALWFLDSRTLAPASEIGQRVAYPVGGRSWTFDGALSPEALGGGIRDAALMSAPVADSRSLELALSAEDADAVHAASMLLKMLQQSDLSTFADAEQIRRIAEYDNLLARLNEARHRLPAADRPVVLAAESVLARIVRGPVDLDDLRQMHETVAALNLPREMKSISDRWQPPRAL